MRHLRAVVVALIVVGCAVAISPPAARADGDPASDILIVSSVYTPVAQKITPSVLQSLQGTVRAADAAGFRVRVALILDRSDLGAVPQLFGHPVSYVQLLAAELAYAWTGAVIAVQPSGVGVRNVKPLGPAQRLVSGIKVEPPASSDSLARAAIVAIRKLAASEGRRVVATTPSASTGMSSSPSSSPTVVTFGAIAVAVVIGCVSLGLILVRRRKPARSR